MAKSDNTLKAVPTSVTHKSMAITRQGIFTLFLLRNVSCQPDTIPEFFYHK